MLDVAQLRGLWRRSLIQWPDGRRGPMARRAQQQGFAGI